MDDKPLLNTYHNGSTAPDADVPAELAAFMVAADPVLANAAELTRVVTHAHQGAATQLIDESWTHARKWFSLSQKYAAWADYKQPARGYGIHARAHQTDAPIRLTDDELRAHPEWRDFGGEHENHPPMRGWLAAPLIGTNGKNYGFLQASDRVEGDFTEQDEANLARLAALTSAALENVARVHIPSEVAAVGS